MILKKLSNLGILALSSTALALTTHPAFAASQSCSASGSGYCQTPSLQAASNHVVHVYINWSNGSCGQWRLKDIRNGKVVKSGSWKGSLVTGYKLDVSGLYSLYLLEVDPGGGTSCTFPSGAVTGTIASP